VTTPVQVSDRPTSAVVEDGLRAREPRRIAGMFDAIARRYDLLNRVLSAGLDQSWRRRAIRALAPGPEDDVLDLCTGTADMALLATSRDGGPQRVVGVDFSHQMLRRGLGKIQAAGRTSRVTLVRGDAMHIPLPDHSMDAAMLAFGIRNVQEPEAACRELARVLRPDGRVAVLEFGLPARPLFRRAYLAYANHLLPAVGRLVSRHASAYRYLPESVGRFPPPERFAELLRRSGFVHVEIRPLTLGIVYLYVARR
jgi:demethylmenaquinone methyltransferase/2-methoxy-6-polyprenyl-1,4-benzoquinol methylase